MKFSDILKGKHSKQSSQSCLRHSSTMSTGLRRETPGQGPLLMEAREYDHLREKQALQTHTDAKSIHTSACTFTSQLHYQFLREGFPGPPIIPVIILSEYHVPLLHYAYWHLNFTFVWFFVIFYNQIIISMGLGTRLVFSHYFASDTWSMVCHTIVAQ